MDAHPVLRFILGHLFAYPIDNVLDVDGAYRQSCLCVGDAGDQSDVLKQIRQSHSALVA